MLAVNHDELIATWASVAAPTTKSNIPVRLRASYEGGAHTRRTIGWSAPTISPNAALLPNLDTLRARSRAAVRNNGFAKGTIDKAVTSIVGLGVTPLPQKDEARGIDKDFIRDEVKLFTRWTSESDPDGVLNFYGQQSQAVRSWLEGGECFARIRNRFESDGLSVPLQVQILEAEFCPHDLNRDLENGHRLRAGIEFDRVGRRVAYWFHPSRPSPGGMDWDFDRSQYRRVPASMVIHLHDPMRPGQYRGEPMLTQALIRLNELDKFDDATLLRQQLANMFLGFLRKPAGEADDFHPLTGETVETFDDEQVMTMEPGTWQELNPGEEVDFSDPPEVKSGYADFIRQQLYHVSAATGVPYETLTGDMSKVNDRTVRVILQEFRRRVKVCQHLIVAHQFCRPIWRAWVDRAVLAGALPVPLVDFIDDPEPWFSVTWTPHGFDYINPVQDVEAAKSAISGGLASSSGTVSERGRDSSEIDEEQAADNERADELGLRYDSDGRTGNAGASLASTDDDDTEDSDDSDDDAGAPPPQEEEEEEEVTE